MNEDIYLYYTTKEHVPNEFKEIFSKCSDEINSRKCSSTLEESLSNLLYIFSCWWGIWNYW